MKNLVLLLTAALLFSRPALAQEDHHEDLTPDQLGSVHFPVSCSESEKQPFERGVALLHSFWYEEAEKEFKQISKDDPGCAMAHWGVAMSLWHQLWNHPDQPTIERGEAEVEAANALHPQSGRERDYIAAMGSFYGDSEKRSHETRAIAYSSAMKRIYQDYPDDREGAAFYALSLLASEPENDATFANRMQAAAVLEKLFAEQPDHPGVAHYLIHSYDKPQLAKLGLPAARRYAQIAPAAPHALHMPSHIFARLGLWQDDIDSNLASIAATRKTAAMHMGGEGHQFHAMSFLEVAYLQSGREAEAEALIEEVKRMPAMKDMYGTGYDPRFYALSDFPALYALELHRWAAAASLVPVPQARSDDSATTYWARAIGSARSGHPSEALKDVEQMERIRATLRAEKKASSASAIDQDRTEALAWIEHAQSKNEEATKALRTIAEKQESTGGEAEEEIPAREMLADMLLEMNRPQQALAEYELDLKFNPNRFNGLYGAARSAELAGLADQSASYYAQLVKVCEGSNSDRAELRRAKELLASK